MNINVTINFGPDDEGYEYTADETAQRILEALGGDSTKDVVTVNMNATGSAGNYLRASVQVSPPVRVLESEVPADSDA